MRQTIRHVLRTACVLLAVSGTSLRAQDVAVSEGWVALPPDGASDTTAFAVVKNPSMYDVYIVSATSDVAESVELRDDDTSVPELTVPAYGSLTMSADGPHLRLVGLKRALEDDESITLTLVTDGSVRLRVSAVVRAE